MMRASNHHAGIDARTRARRIANLRSRQVFARQSDAQRNARLAWLAQLAGAIEAGDFTQADLMQAEAALAECDSRQHRLDLGTNRRACT